MPGESEFDVTRTTPRLADDKSRGVTDAESRNDHPLLGRHAETASLRALITNTTRPVITVVGEPGIGKTALIRSALNGLTEPPVAVSHVDAGAWTGADAIPQLRAHMSSLRVPLRARPLVVVHRADGLIAEYGALTALMGDVEPVTFVLESAREPSGEWANSCVRVGPLRDEDAAELFRHTAESIGITLAHDQRTTTLVGQICHAVDRNPFGIGLAAARLRIMTLDELDSMLASPRSAVAVLSSFTWGQRGAPMKPEHADAPLRADTSEHLLDVLSVFAGTFTLRAVDAVTDGVVSRPLDKLTELIDARLVQVDEDGGDRRFRLSRLVRAHAATRLQSSGDEGPARERHASYFSVQARHAASAAEDADDYTARAIMGGDRAEMWEALRYLIDRDSAAALRLAADLTWDAQGRGTAAELAAIIERLLVTSPMTDPTIRRDALLSLTELQSWVPGASDRAQVIRRRLDEAMTLARSINEPLCLLRAHHVRYLAVTTDGDLANAVEACTQGIELATELGHVRWLGRFEVSLSALWAFIEQWETAIPLALSGLSRALRSEDKRAVVHGSIVVHSAPREFVEDGTSIPTLESVLEMAVEVGDATNESHVLAALAYRAIEAGDHAEALRWVAVRHERLGRAELLHGLTVSTMLASLAAHLRGDVDTAVRLHSAIAPALESLLTVLPARNAQRYNEMLRDVREHIGSVAFEAELARGRLRGREEARTELSAYLESADLTLSRTTQGPAPTLTNLTTLSPREQQVLRELARGLRNKEIAVELHITPKTVMHHTVAIYRKLGVRSRAEAATHPIAQTLTQGAEDRSDAS